MKKEHKPGIFFTDPSDSEVSVETKKTVQTFLEGEHDLTDIDHTTGDYKKIINLTYGQKKKKKREI